MSASIKLLGKEVTKFMKKILFKGCGTAISTPFNENGVNFKEFEKLIENQIQNKVDALIVCGTTGEASTMTTEEKIATIQCAVKTSHRKNSYYCWYRRK